MEGALTKGLEFMVIGMSVVFMFLVLMILVMKLSHILVTFLNKYMPEEEAMENPLQRSVHSHDDVAVAIAAVKNFTKN
jgi:oxaloacetate decarboxylase gamma subunit